MDGAQKAYILAVVFMIISFSCFVLAGFAALHYRGASSAEAPIAAFSKNGDDRTLPPLLSGLRRSVKSLPPNVPTVLNDVTPAPALFVYGDSTVDVGNNNNLATLAKANRPPYGRDFDTHQPTGRFCNGRLSVDYLALYMGLSGYTLPYEPFVRTAFLSTTRALNFASAGAGILDASGEDLGQHIPLTKQVRNMRMVASQQAYNTETSAVIAQPVHFISIGSNDFIHTFLRNISEISEKKKHFNFSSGLTEKASQIIEELYGNGARRIAVTGIGPLGCVPHYLYVTNTTEARGCVGNINFMVLEFNALLESTIASIRKRHEDLHIIYCDTYSTMSRLIVDPKGSGFQSARMACCGLGRFGGGFTCVHPSMACDDASEYVWWDQFHPTERANAIIAKETWSGNACRPFTMQQLSRL